MMRVVIYTRVSSQEQLDGYSLSAQAEAARRFAEQRNWKVVGLYEERGRSGKTALRPEFQQMISDARNRMFDTILVHKLDRFSRSLLDTMSYLKLLNEHGVSVASVTEPELDFTTAHGKVMIGILSIFSQWYIDNLSQETSKGKRERARKGGWNGTLSWGYTTPRRLQQELTELGNAYRAGHLEEEEYSRETERMERDLERYPGYYETQALPCTVNSGGVKLGYRRYSTGQYSDRDIAWILNDAGYRINGKPFGKDTIRDLLQNRFYTGMTSYRGKKKGAQRAWIAGDHEPIVDEELFERCQVVRKRRADSFNRGSPTQRRCYPLASLLVCLECGKTWRGWPLRDERYYRDSARDVGLKCHQSPKSVKAVELEQEIEEAVLNLRLPADWRERAQQLLMEQEPDVVVVRRKRLSMQARLKRLKRLFVLGDIDEVEYAQIRDELQSRVPLVPVSAERQLNNLEGAANLLRNVRQLWYSATLEERKEWLQALFHRVYIEEGHIKAIEPTPVMWVLLQLSGYVIPGAGATGFEPC